MKIIEAVAKATANFNNKLSRPAYKAYKENEDLQEELFMDCLNEAMASVRFNGVRNV